MRDMKMRETLFWAAIHNRRPQEVRCSAVSVFQAVIAVQLNSTQSVFIAVTVRLQLKLKCIYKRSRNNWNNKKL